MLPCVWSLGCFFLLPLMAILLVSKKTFKCSASRTCLPINWRCFVFACLLVLEFESHHHPNSCWQQFLRVFHPKSFNLFLLCILVVLFILPSYLWLAGWMDDRSSTAAHITENVMCTVSASACGRYIVVTCLIPISASQRWHLQLSGRTWGPRYRAVARAPWQMWWRDVGMPTLTGGQRWMKWFLCWKRLIHLRVEVWFLLISSRAVCASVDTAAHDDIHFLHVE